MRSDEAKLIYKDRAASIGCTNAHLRNRGLQRFNVRGTIKARAVLLWPPRRLSNRVADAFGKARVPRFINPIC